MEASELYNFSISPVVTGTFVIERSQDNHISLITHQGVHVFELLPHPTCIYPSLKLARTFMYSSAYLPTEPYASVIGQRLRGMKREEMYTIFLDEALTPSLEDKNSPKPRIISVVWSPLGLAKPEKCLCAIVTSMGSVELVNKFGSDWSSMWNLTERWIKLVEAESKIEPNVLMENPELGSVLTDHLRRFLGTAANWSCLFRDRDGKNFAWLAVAFRSCEIVVAKVREVNELCECHEEPRIVYKCRFTSKSRIDRLLWLTLEPSKSHVIMIAYADGRIHGLKLDEIDGKLEENRLLKYEDRPDLAKITSARLFTEMDGNFVVVLTKSACLVVLSLDRNGECYRTRYLKIDGFSITGLTTVSREKVLLTTQNGKMYAVTILESEDLSCEAVCHDLKSTKVQYLGLVSSENSSILLNVTSPDGVFDHLMNREPSIVQVFRLTGEQWNPWAIIRHGLSAKMSLRTYWDCLEALRIIAAKSSADPRTILPKISNDMESLDTNELRMFMWLTLISEILEKRQFLKGVEKIVGPISEAEPLVFLLSGCDLVGRLLKKSRESLSAEERRSVSFLRMYMEIFLAGEEEDDDDDEEETTRSGGVTEKILETFRASEFLVDAIDPESCDLCHEVLTELPWLIESCPSGHKLPRCALSLLQITGVNFRSCPICARLYHPFLDKIYPQLRCIYCDVAATYDDRLRSSARQEMEKKWTNLSRRPYDNIEKPKNQPDGNELVSEKIKRRSIHDPQTFAVIVNRDQHDDSLITETWQEF